MSWSWRYIIQIVLAGRQSPRNEDVCASYTCSSVRCAVGSSARPARAARQDPHPRRGVARACVATCKHPQSKYFIHYRSTGPGARRRRAAPHHARAAAGPGARGSAVDGRRAASGHEAPPHALRTRRPTCIPLKPHPSIHRPAGSTAAAAGMPARGTRRLRTPTAVCVRGILNIRSFVVPQGKPRRAPY